MNITPASVKIRRWFVAGVAAVMAIAWTVSSLVTPGSADVAIPENNVDSAVGQVITSPTLTYKKKTNIFDWSANGLYFNHSGYAVKAQSVNSGMMTVNGSDNKDYRIMCIDMPNKIINGDTYEVADIDTYVQARPPKSNQANAQAAGWFVQKYKYIFDMKGLPISNEATYRQFFQDIGLPYPQDDWDFYKVPYIKDHNLGVLDPERTGLAAAPTKRRIDQAIRIILQGAFWSVDGTLDISKTRAKTGEGFDADMPRVNAMLYMIAPKIQQQLISAKWSGVVGGAGTTTPEGATVTEAGFNANGQYVVTYKFDAVKGAKTGKVSIKGMPTGGTLVNNANGSIVADGSTVNLPATLTLTLPDKTYYAHVKINVLAEVPGGTTTVDGYHVIPVDFKGPQGMTGTVSFENLPADAKIEDLNGNPVTQNSTVITLPTRLMVYVKPGTMTAPIVGKFKQNANNGTANAQVSVFEQSRSVLNDGSTHIRIGVTGVGDNQEATLTVSGLPAGVSLTTEDGTLVQNGSVIKVPNTLNLIVPEGTNTSTISIGATTKSTTGGSPGTILKPSNGTGQWVVVIDEVPGSSATANASINVTWNPIVIPKDGSFTLKKAVIGTDTLNAKDFTFKVNCVNGNKTFPEETIVLTPNDDPKTSETYPENTVCTISEDKPAYKVPGSDYLGVVYTGGNVLDKANQVKIVPGQTPAINIVATNKYVGPELKTQAGTQDNNPLEKGKPLQLTDTVTVNNVKCDGTYTVGGHFVKKEDGSKATDSYFETFVPQDQGFDVNDDGSCSGSITLTSPKWTVTPDKNKQAFVAFEYLYKGTSTTDEPIVKHENPEDSAQTVISSEKAAFNVIKKLKVDGTLVNVNPEGVGPWNFEYRCKDSATGTFGAWSALGSASANGVTADSPEVNKGSVCQVRELASNAPTFDAKDVEWSGANGKAAADNAWEFTVDANTESINITATNELTKKKGSFKIVKKFAEGSSYTGNASSPHMFDFNVTCGGNAAQKVQISDAGEWASPEYPVGTECSVEELTESAAITGHVFEGVTVTTTKGTVAGKTATFTVDEGANSVTVTAANKYTKAKGTFTVKKAVDNGPAAVNNDFSFTATCDDGTNQTATTKKDGTAVFDSHDYGTECTITESESSVGITDYIFKGVTFAGGEVAADGKSTKVVVKDESTPVVVTATNKYQPQGEITITKTVTGGPATVDNVYNFTAKCGAETNTVSVKNGQTASFGKFPVGTSCTITEGAENTAITDYTYKGVTFTGGDVAADGKSTTVTVKEASTKVEAKATNTYEQDKGSFKIVKKFAEGSSYTGGADNSFEFDVTCAGKPVADVSIVDAGEWTSSEYPVGTKCTITEKTSSASIKGHSFKGVKISSNAGSISNNVATITITKGETPNVTVTAENDYAKPSFKTDASIKGDNELVKGKATQLTDRITFTGLEKGKTYTTGGYFIDKATGKAVTGFYTKQFTTADLQGVTEANGLVNGYLDLTDPKWTVTPESNAGVSYVAFEYLWEGTLPTTPEVPTNPGTDEVTPKPDEKHENPDDPNQTVTSDKKGSFTIEKKVVGPAAGKVPADAVFPFTVDCGAPRVENVSANKPFTSAELPEGTKCTVTENDAPAHFEGATFSKVALTLDGAAVTGDSVTFTVKAGDKPMVAVVAENSYDTPEVTTDAEPEVPAQEGKPVTVTDKVTYTNLIAGKTYTVEGQLHYQEGDAPNATDGGVVKGVQPGEGYQVGSKPDSVATTFTAPGKAGELVSGTVDLVFIVPAEAVQSKPMVVFEDVYYEGKKVAGHHDINDDKQTVPVDEKIEFPIKKLLAGDGADKANGTYNFVANCAKPGETAEDQTVSATVTDGVAAVSVGKIVTYVGETCTIKEVGPEVDSAVTSVVNFADSGIAGVTGGKTLTVKVTKDNKDKIAAADFAFEATNTVTLKKAKFSVTKTDATAEGNVTLPSDYTFEYNCAGTTGSLTVAKGEVAEGPELPIGTNCSIKETGATVPNTHLTTTWTVDGVATTANADGAVNITLGEQDQTVAVAATNKYKEKTGKFTIAKKLSASVTTQNLTGQNYKFNYSCVDANGSVVAKSATPVEAVANGAPVTVGPIPVGATCSVEEVKDAMPSAPNAVHELSWTIDNAAISGEKPSFTITDEEVAVNVVAINSYNDKKPGFNVKKVVTGDAKDKPAEFTFDVACNDGTKGDFTITETTGFQSANDEQFKDLQVGTECTLTERAPADIANTNWNGVTYSQSGNTSDVWTVDSKNQSVTFAVPAGETAVTVTATNNFSQERGKINVQKIVKANGVKGVESTFTFGLECSFDSKPIALDAKYVTLRDGETGTWENLPVGATCKVTELATQIPDNSTHALTWTIDGSDAISAESVEVTVKAGETGVGIVATNSYSKNPAGFSIEKKSAVATPDGVKLDIPNEFKFSYRCGTATEWTLIDQAVTVGGPKVTVENLVADETCEIREENDSLPSRIVKWTVDGASTPVEGDTVTITPSAGQTVAIVVDNKYPTTPEIGTKLTDPAGKQDVSADGETVTLKDVVTYYNLDTSKTYKASGKLMAWDAEGKVIETGIKGETEFKPETVNGSVIVEFQIPSAKLIEFAKVVAYEKLTLNGEVVATHENPEDENQIVKVKPTIGTTLTGEDGKAKTYDRPTNPDATVKLIDTVTYTNLRVGKTYRIAGELYGDNGLTGVKAMSDPFTVEAPEDNPKAEFVSGTKEIVFEVPGSVLQANTKLVAFEQLWDEGKLEPKNPGDEKPEPKNPEDTPDAKHEDPNDENQTVKRNPSVATSAAAKNSEGKAAKVVELADLKGDTVEIIDTMTWYDLKAGDYVAVAVVVDSNGEPIDGPDSVNGTKAFTVSADQKQGNVDVPMTVKVDKTTSEQNVVVFEYVYNASDVNEGKANEGATPVATHENASDPNQTIKLVPQPPAPPASKLIVKKTLGEGDGYTKLPADTLYGFELSCADAQEEVTRFVLKAEEEVSDIWTQDLSGQECTITEVGPVKGEYTEADGWNKVELENMVWSDILWSENGEPKFSAVEGNGPTAGPQNTAHTFTVPAAEGEAQKELTVEASNYFKPTLPPETPETEKPEVKTPTLKTSAQDMRQNNPVNGVDRTVRWGSSASIEDTVTFTNLEVGKEYTLKGQIMDKATSKAVTAVGLSDKNECGIEANGAKTAMKCKDEGNGVISLTFTLPGEADSYVNGVATMQFKIAAEAVKEDAKYVVFEEAFVTRSGGGLESVVKHHDINDADQTITTQGCPDIPPSNPPAPDLPDNPGTPPDLPDDNCPRISTTLNVDGTDKVVRGKDHTMTDTIYYVDLLPNKEYKMLGRLHVGNDETAAGVIKSVKPGTKCFADGKPATCKDEGNGFVSITFTTGDSNNRRGYVDGAVDMQFIVPEAALSNTDKIVAFETAFDKNGYMVAWHHDITSEPQTQLIRQPEPPTPTVPGTPVKHVTPPTLFHSVLARTGAATFTLLILGLMGLIGGGVLVWASPARRRKEDDR